MSSMYLEGFYQCMAAVVMIMDLIGGEGIRYHMEIARLDYAVLSICLKTSYYFSYGMQELT